MTEKWKNIEIINGFEIGLPKTRFRNQYATTFHWVVSVKFHCFDHVWFRIVQLKSKHIQIMKLELFSEKKGETKSQN